VPVNFIYPFALLLVPCWSFLLLVPGPLAA
jgi:hypothetical protein